MLHWERGSRELDSCSEVCSRLAGVYRASCTRVAPRLLPASMPLSMSMPMPMLMAFPMPTPVTAPSHQRTRSTTLACVYACVYVQVCVHASGTGLCLWLCQPCVYVRAYVYAWSYDPLCVVVLPQYPDCAPPECSPPFWGVSRLGSARGGTWLPSLILPPPP